MATRAQLRERWNTPAGNAAAREVEAALLGGAGSSQIAAIIAGLPLLGEVAPALDLRGIELPTLVTAKKTDLSGVRFDSARINWCFGGSTLRAAVFDEAEGRNIDFGGCDLTGSSFVQARLPGAIFFGARLVDANLTGIRMRGGQLKAAVCTRAKFPGADLRMVWAAEADLRGSDLSDANLVGASLGGAKWDKATRFDRAQLSLEGTPAELRAYAICQAASILSEKAEWQLSLLDATARALEDEYGPSTARIVSRLSSLRPELERDPAFSWASILRDELDDSQWRIVQEAVRKAACNIGALLG